MSDADRAQQIAQVMAAMNGGQSPSTNPQVRKNGANPTLVVVLVVLSLIAVIAVAVRFASSFSPEHPEATADTTIAEQPTTTSEHTKTPDTARVERPQEAIEQPSNTYLLVDTPSKNLSCEIYDDHVGCSIAERYYSDLGLPNCNTRLFSIMVTNTGVEKVCGKEFLGKPGDFVRELQYGESITSPNGKYQCSIAESGMTCNNTKTGRGFKIAREEQRIF